MRLSCDVTMLQIHKNPLQVRAFSVTGPFLTFPHCQRVYFVNMFFSSHCNLTLHFAFLDMTAFSSLRTSSPSAFNILMPIISQGSNPPRFCTCSSSSPWCPPTIKACQRLKYSSQKSQFQLTTLTQLGCHILVSYTSHFFPVRCPETQLALEHGTLSSRSTILS